MSGQEGPKQDVNGRHRRPWPVRVFLLICWIDLLILCPLGVVQLSRRIGGDSSIQWEPPIVLIAVGFAAVTILVRTSGNAATAPDASGTHLGA